MRRRHVQLAADDAMKNGITSFQDMGSSFETIDLLETMADEGNLPIRLYMAIQETAEDMKDKLADYRKVGYGDGYLTVRTIGEKVLDGALGTHGGWLLEPYTDLPRSVGFEVTPVTEIEASAALAMEHDYQMAIQGIGDRAARILFDIYEKEFEKTTPRVTSGGVSSMLKSSIRRTCRGLPSSVSSLAFKVSSRAPTVPGSSIVSAKSAPENAATSTVP